MSETEFKLKKNEFVVPPSKIVEFSRGELETEYEGYDPKDRETGDVNYDCE